MTGLNRRTVAKRLKEEELKPYKKRSCKSKLDDFKGYIEQRIRKALPDRIRFKRYIRRDLGNGIQW